MSIGSTSMALVLYVPPRTPMEFIQSEVKRGLATGSISIKNGEVVHQVSFSKKLNGDEIVEALQSEAVFTIATDNKPIVATHGCGPCIAVGGYETTNKIAFVVHFAHAGEVEKSGELLFYNISRLAKKKIEKPIHIHLRGGVTGQSEATIKAIKTWMQKRDDVPMGIASEEVLLTRWNIGRSLLIDSRDGTVAEYDPRANPKCRVRSVWDILSALMSAFIPKIKVVYSPQQ